jgi:hypothetical protein
VVAIGEASAFAPQRFAPDTSKRLAMAGARAADVE